MSNNHFIS